MAKVSSCKKYCFALLVLFLLSAFLFHGIHGLRNEQKIPATELTVISHEFCQTCPLGVSALKDIRTYSELKYDPRALLPVFILFTIMRRRRLAFSPLTLMICWAVGSLVFWNALVISWNIASGH